MQIIEKKDDRPFVLIGSGGHSKVVHSMLLENQLKILGVCEPYNAEKDRKVWRGSQVLGDDLELLKYVSSEIFIANGIGFADLGVRRRQVYDFFNQKGYVFPGLIHPNAYVDKSVIIRNGVQIMAGCVIQADVVIGENSVINTGVLIDHDSVIGANVHIAPGAKLCGGVTIGSGSYVGAGSVVIQGAEIQADKFVKALTLVKCN